MISLAGELAHDALALPCEYHDPIVALWKSIAAEFVEIDVGIRALREIYDWATCNQAHFYRQDVEREPSGGWFGYWECENPSWNSLNVAPTVLKAQLERMGYTSKEVLHNWREKGWLVLEGQGENPRFRLGHQRLRMVSVKRGAIAEVTDDDFPELACSFTLVHVDDGSETD